MLDLLLINPDDDLPSMQATMDLATGLNCEFANFYSAMSYPGAPLHQMAVVPESWSGFSQHSPDCLPLRTDHIPAEQVLRFRDEAFHRYFGNSRHLDMVERVFGPVTRRHVGEMSEHRLRRRLLEQAERLSAA